MVGGGNRKDDAASTTNIFAALERRTKKSSRRRSDKDQQQELKDFALPTSNKIAAQWVPVPLSVTSWADCEEDDDDYFAMRALPPLPRLDDDQANAVAEEDQDEEDADEDESIHGEGSEAYDELEEGNNENKEPWFHKANKPGTDVNNCMAAREPDKQLSKKELKKKGLAELEAALAELGLNQQIKKDSAKTTATKEAATTNSKEAKAQTLAESKSSKRRKAKKEKVTEGREEETPYRDGAIEVEPSIMANEANTGPLDKGEVLKKVSLIKKKKSKDGDSAAKAAVAEAAVRSAKLAAARKKEKNHYNQHPVR